MSLSHAAIDTIGYAAATMTPVWLANAVTFLLSVSMLMLKLRFDRRAASPHQPEDAPR